MANRVSSYGDDYFGIGVQVGFIFSVPVFFLTWWWAIASAGPFGLVFGWIPALVVAYVSAFVVALLWLPLALILFVAVGWVVYSHGGLA